MTTKEQLEQLVAKVDAMSLRERVLIFFAAAFLLVALIDALFLNPLLTKQKALSAQVVQQQEKMKEMHAQMTGLTQARQENAESPLRERIRMLRKQVADGEEYLQKRRDKLVPPEKMGELLEQVLKRNRNLQLMSLNTLPVSLLIEPSGDGMSILSAEGESQIYKHGVEITVRGSYADLTEYLRALEHLPSQMFWGVAKLNVVEYPAAELKLTLYTLSLDKRWLKV